MMLSACETRIGGDEHRRQDGEILRDVVGDGEGGQRAAADQQLLADSHHLDQLGRVAVEIDQVAGLSCRRRAGCSWRRRHRPAPAPAHRSSRRRTSRPACPGPARARISSSFFSGVASARKSSTPASAAIAAAVSGLSPVIMTVRMPIRRSWAKRSRMPGLTMSFKWITPSRRRSRATRSGVPPVLEMRSTIARQVGRCA